VVDDGDNGKERGAANLSIKKKEGRVGKFILEEQVEPLIKEGFQKGRVKITGERAPSSPGLTEYFDLVSPRAQVFREHPVVKKAAGGVVKIAADQKSDPQVRASRYEPQAEGFSRTSTVMH
jgi:hypothetical protein